MTFLDSVFADTLMTYELYNVHGLGSHACACQDISYIASFITCSNYLLNKPGDKWIDSVSVLAQLNQLRKHRGSSCLFVNSGIYSNFTNIWTGCILEAVSCEDVKYVNILITMMYFF